MKSFCIKCNNTKINNYLLKSFKKYKLDNLFISYKRFKSYNNVILHYKGNINIFYDCFCDVLTECVIKFCEKSEIEKIINYNYFYFSDFEQSIILNSCIEYLKDINNLETMTRKETIYVSFLKYIDEEKFFIFDGFVNFRLKQYKKILEYVVDTCVNNYLIEKEYNEFINLLKIYINSKEPKTNTIHLLYQNKECILLDSDHNLIQMKDYFSNAKYLSDISFSSNDYALNALLTLLPKKLYIHIIDNEDEFIDTLKLIFENRISICKHCSLCTKYRMINNIKQ